jgi:hypothetical protein
VPRRPAKPKVTYTWGLRDDGRGARAVCNLRCGFMLDGSSRNDLYPSTANHKRQCPKLLEWQRAHPEPWRVAMANLKGT